MARMKILRSLVEQSEKDVPPEEDSNRPTGAIGGAWRAGATAQLKADLAEREADLAARVLEGRAELLLKPEQIEDPLGSDRRENWRSQPEFLELRASIEANGQDQPIQVAPQDPEWRPSPRDPYAVEGVSFDLLAGRRRLAVLQDLGRKARAVVVPVDGLGAVRRMAMLARRWRENVEREDLSPFERLLSIGDLFDAAVEAAAETGAPKPTATAFGAELGVSESMVSRARTVSSRRDAIKEAVEDPYALSMSALYALLPRLDAPKRPPAAASASPNVLRQAGPIRLEARVKNGALKLSAKGLPKEFDEDALTALVEKVLEQLKGENQTGGA